MLYRIPGPFWGPFRGLWGYFLHSYSNIYSYSTFKLSFEQQTTLFSNRSCFILWTILHKIWTQFGFLTSFMFLCQKIKMTLVRHRTVACTVLICKSTFSLQFIEFSHKQCAVNILNTAALAQVRIWESLFFFYLCNSLTLCQTGREGK